MVMCINKTRQDHAVLRIDNAARARTDFLLVFFLKLRGGGLFSVQCSAYTHNTTSAFQCKDKGAARHRSRGRTTARMTFSTTKIAPSGISAPHTRGNFRGAPCGHWG